MLVPVQYREYEVWATGTAGAHQILYLNTCVEAVAKT